ncbi:unnamed protein product, partial [Mesorhabditis spiculigera]
MSSSYLLLALACAALAVLSNAAEKEFCAALGPWNEALRSEILGHDEFVGKLKKFDAEHQKVVAAAKGSPDLEKITDCLQKKLDKARADDGEAGKLPLGQPQFEKVRDINSALLEQSLACVKGKCGKF